MLTRLMLRMALGTVLCVTLSSIAGEADKREKVAALQRDIQQCFKEKKWEEAAAKCREVLALSANDSNAGYDLACALARLGKNTDALASLSKSVDDGFDDAAHMKVDEDLQGLHDDKRFGEIVARAAEKERTGNYEKGAEIKGVKTVEGYPEGGLRYRLRMSEDASENKPNRLVIWLHPSGGSMNNVAESLAPIFVKHGYALLVLTKKNWMGWTSDDALKLLMKTLPEVSKIPGITGVKPTLMGYSAGGQLALQLWESNGAKFRGLILDAAYPLDMARYARGQAAVMELPKDEGTRKVPMFVLVGLTDGGSRMWQQCEEPWRKDGVPLTISYIPNKGHTWLFGKTEVDNLMKWMDGL